MNIHFLSPGENRKHGQTLKRYSERCLCPLQLSLVCHKPILGMRSCGHRQTNVQVLGDALKHWLKKKQSMEASLTLEILPIRCILCSFGSRH